MVSTKSLVIFLKIYFISSAWSFHALLYATSIFYYVQMVKGLLLQISKYDNCERRKTNPSGMSSTGSAVSVKVVLNSV